MTTMRPDGTTPPCVLSASGGGNFFFSFRFNVDASLMRNWRCPSCSSLHDGVHSNSVVSEYIRL